MRITEVCTSWPDEQRLYGHAGQLVAVQRGEPRVTIRATDVNADEHHLMSHAAHTGKHLSAHLLMLHSIPRAERIRLLQESLIEEMESNTTSHP